MTGYESETRAHDTYIAHTSQPYAKHYAAGVGRFQEGFLRDKVCADLEDAFVRAVDTCERLLPAIKARA